MSDKSKKRAFESAPPVVDEDVVVTDVQLGDDVHQHAPDDAPQPVPVEEPQPAAAETAAAEPTMIVRTWARARQQEPMMQAFIHVLGLSRTVKYSANEWATLFDAFCKEPRG